MSRREDIDNSIWEDEDFDALSDDAAFIYLWSFTNPRCPMAGIYKVKARSIIEGRMTPARRTAALAELQEARFVFYVDGWLWVRSRVKHLRTRGEKIATSIIRDVERIPTSHPLRAAFLSEYLKNSWISKWLVDANLEDPSIPHSSPIHGVQGMGKGTGSTSLEEEKDPRDVEWGEWLAHYQTTTERTAVRGSDEARRAFNARRRKFSLDDLKLATVGCHADLHLRERGFNRPETILRESKVERFIELGRTARARGAKPGSIGDPALAAITGRPA